MAKSSLLGIEPLNPGAPGHDDLALGPSDSSDSGSDMAGLDAVDDADPTMPVDRALADDAGRAWGGADALGAGSDASGTGERRSAGSDAGLREAGDISVDRVFSPFADGDAEADAEDDVPLSEDEEAAALDAAVDSAAEDEADAEDDEAADSGGSAVEDESADPVGDGRSDAALAEALRPPGRRQGR